MRKGKKVHSTLKNVRKALEISDNAYMLMNGRVVFAGRSEELLEHEKFERFCMGI